MIEGQTVATRKLEQPGGLLATGIVLILVGTWFLLSIAGTPHQSASASIPAAGTLAPMSGRPANASSAPPVLSDRSTPLARGGDHFPVQRDGPPGQAQAPSSATQSETGDQTYRSARRLGNESGADRKAFRAEGLPVAGTHRAPTRRLAAESTTRHRPTDAHKATSSSSRSAIVKSQGDDRTERNCACGAADGNRMPDRAMSEPAPAAATTSLPANAKPVQ